MRNKILVSLLVFLCGYLIGTGDRLLNRLDRWVESPLPASYEGYDSEKQEFYFNVDTYTPNVIIPAASIGLNPKTAPILDMILRYNDNVLSVTPSGPKGTGKLYFISPTRDVYINEYLKQLFPPGKEG